MLLAPRYGEKLLLCFILEKSVIEEVPSVVSASVVQGQEQVQSNFISEVMTNAYTNCFNFLLCLHLRSTLLIVNCFRKEIIISASSRRRSSVSSASNRTLLHGRTRMSLQLSLQCLNGLLNCLLNGLLH